MAELNDFNYEADERDKKLKAAKEITQSDVDITVLRQSPKFAALNQYLIAANEKIVSYQNQLTLLRGAALTDAQTISRYMDITKIYRDRLEKIQRIAAMAVLKPTKTGHRLAINEILRRTEETLNEDS